jgi:hypothetical protein
VRRKCGNFVALLAKYFPNHPWDTSFKARISKGKNQNYLFNSLQTLFPNTDIQLNYKHPDLTHTKTNTAMEFDIYLPTLSLAFEYQGIKVTKVTLKDSQVNNTTAGTSCMDLQNLKSIEIRRKSTRLLSQG